MIGLAMLLTLAAAAYAVRRALRIPLIPLLLLAGMALRALGLALGEEVARSALDIGLAVIVFGAGMELNPKRFGQQRSNVWVIGLAQFAIIGLGATLWAIIFGQEWLTALYIGLAISTSSTLIIVRLLKERQQMFEPFGRVVTGVLLLQDLLIILLIVVLMRLPDGMDALLHGLGGMTIMLVLCFAGLRYVMPFIVLRMKIDQETLALTILAVLFLFMGLAYVLDLPIITGAFLAGVSLSAFPVNSAARGLVQSLTAFFVSMFFIVLGGLMTWPAAAEWGLILTLSAWVLVATPLLVVAIACRRGLNARSAIEGGLLLAMTSEFSLLVALQGIMAGQLSMATFNVLAMTTVLTMTLTPLWATDRTTWWLMHRFRSAAPTRLQGDVPARDHVVMLGYGKGSSVVVKALRNEGHEVVIVNDDPVVVEELVEAGERAVCGDGSDPRTLDMVNASAARALISSMRRVRDAEKVLAQLQPDPPLLIARVFEPAEADRIRARGGVPVLSSAAAADAFMQWFQQTREREKQASA